MSNKILFFLVFIALSYATVGQMTVSFPTSRAVFQRDNFSNGSVPVSGVAAADADKIEARLVARSANQGTTTNWQVIDSQLNVGSFSGEVKGTGGWYNLEIRSFKAGIVLSQLSIERIGIGEVFIIAGQSNAQGLSRYPYKGALDDRVNGYNYNTLATFEEPFPLADFAHVDQSLNIGPHGQSSWAYGELGDSLVLKFNVPVLFFNTAFEGATIENFRKSALGQPTIHTGFGFTFPPGSPYNFLKNTLQSLVPLYGMRNIIWMQGESDYPTTQSQYYTDLKFLINQVTNDTGKNINWLVSRTSLVFNTKYPQIIAAQNQVISEFSNVFPGPITDTIQNPRNDQVHFQNEGIGLLARALNKSLSSSFINSITPILGNQILPIVSTCAGQNVNVGIAGTYKSYLWNTGATSSVITLNSGLVYVQAKDSFGNLRISEQFYPERLFPKPPIITASSYDPVCEGSGILISRDNSSLKVEWQDGTNTTNFFSTKAESVFATYVGNNGCVSQSSNVITTQFKPRPAKPVITSNSETYGACDGVNVILSARSSGAASFLWSNGQRSNQVAIGKLGEQVLSVIGYAANGCPSEVSETQKVFIYPNPEPPNIIQDGPFSLTLTNAENYDQLIWSLNGSELTGVETTQIMAQQDGIYAAKGIVYHEAPFVAACLSPSSPILSYQRKNDHDDIVVYPNPVDDSFVYLTAQQQISSAQIQLFNMKGENILRPTVINKIDVPRKLIFPNGLAGKHILVIIYNGTVQRVPLVFR